MEKVEADLNQSKAVREKQAKEFSYQLEDLKQRNEQQVRSLPEYYIILYDMPVCLSVCLWIWQAFCVANATVIIFMHAYILILTLIQSMTNVS